MSDNVKEREGRSKARSEGMQGKLRSEEKQSSKQSKVRNKEKQSDKQREKWSTKLLRLTSFLSEIAGKFFSLILELRQA